MKSSTLSSISFRNRSLILAWWVCIKNRCVQIGFSVNLVNENIQNANVFILSGSGNPQSL